MAKVKHKKVLVVDDEHQLLEHLTNILKRAGYDVFATGKGVQAIELAQSERPDIIILDIMLPDMDGSEISRRLADEPSTSAIPIVFLTGILRKEEELNISKTGRSYVMAKPVTGEDLLEMVSRVLSEK